MALDREQIMAALRTVKDPELFKDIVTLNMVKDIAISGADIAFTIDGAEWRSLTEDCANNLIKAPYAERLFDAVGKGNLAVPAHILKVETELKKEWNKREREAKQAAKKPLVP